MSFLQRLGIHKQKPDQDVVSALVDDVVDRAMELHHEARVAIRDDGKVTALMEEALAPDRPRSAA